MSNQKDADSQDVAKRELPPPAASTPEVIARVTKGIGSGATFGSLPTIEGRESMMLALWGKTVLRDLARPKIPIPDPKLESDPGTRTQPEAPTSGNQKGHKYRNVTTSENARQLNGDVGSSGAQATCHLFEKVCATGNGKQVNGNILTSDAFSQFMT